MSYRVYGLIGSLPAYRNLSRYCRNEISMPKEEILMHLTALKKCFPYRIYGKDYLQNEDKIGLIISDNSVEIHYDNIKQSVAILQKLNLFDCQTFEEFLCKVKDKYLRPHITNKLITELLMKQRRQPILLESLIENEALNELTLMLLAALVAEKYYGAANIFIFKSAGAHLRGIDLDSDDLSYFYVEGPLLVYDTGTNLRVSFLYRDPEEKEDKYLLINKEVWILDEPTYGQGKNASRKLLLYPRCKDFFLYEYELLKPYESRLFDIKRIEMGIRYRASLKKERIPELIFSEDY